MVVLGWLLSLNLISIHFSSQQDPIQISSEVVEPSQVLRQWCASNEYLSKIFQPLW